MKNQKLLTPLAMAVAALLSVGAHAAGYSGASADITDSQENKYNDVDNKGTNNTAAVSGSLGGASGNVGVNVAAGENNQQANAAAIATSDALFVFGLPIAAAAQASIDVEQKNYMNDVTNYSVPNAATLSNSAGGASGNLGINIAAGTSNQQKNDMAIASSQTAYTAGANVNVEQHSSGNETSNQATLQYSSQHVTLALGAVGGYKGVSDQIGDVYPDIWTGNSHPNGNQTGHFDLDSDTQGGTDLNDDGGALAFKEAGVIALGGVVSGYLPVVSGFNQAVTNTARVTNSLGGVSGNVGVNIAAGSGNQQSNSLEIAAGFNACVPAGGGNGGGEL